MASIGLPGTNGFIAELLMLLGILQTAPIVAAIALLGVILGATYFLGFFQRAFLGPVVQPAVASAMDLRPRELLIASVMGLLVLTGGLFPSLAQKVTVSAANAWVMRMTAHLDNNPASFSPENDRESPP